PPHLVKILGVSGRLTLPACPFYHNNFACEPLDNKPSVGRVPTGGSGLLSVLIFFRIRFTFGFLVIRRCLFIVLLFFIHFVALFPGDLFPFSWLIWFLLLLVLRSTSRPAVFSFIAIRSLAGLILGRLFVRML